MRRARPLRRFDRLAPPLRPGDRHERLVVCPRCSGCARLIDVTGPPNDQRRLSCTACGAVVERPAGFRWWLRTRCCGQVLRASSAEHLALLQAFIGSPLRERLRENWPDRELLARLPRWMILARHRDEVLRAIERLKDMLPGADLNGPARRA